ncbi:c-type cytochrome [Comamonas sp.]|uniref:c-type cytochrome n=1 Tax=Comamonas sp. TaxID=34028 RepID=UPI003A8D9083
MLLNPLNHLLAPASRALCLSAAIAACVATTSVAAAPTALRAQDVAVLAASCANCHGPDGRSTGGIPSLRGVGEAHLLQRLQAFKAGTAKDATVMTRLAKGYDDEQIKALAQWFSKEAQ